MAKRSAKVQCIIMYKSSFRCGCIFYKVKILDAGSGVPRNVCMSWLCKRKPFLWSGARSLYLAAIKLERKPLCGYHGKFQSCHRNRCSYWILKTFLSEIRHLSIWSSICILSNIFCWNWTAIPVKNLIIRNWNDFFFCFQKLAIQIVNLFHSSRWKNVTCIKVRNYCFIRP